jgi:hypothetical protein
VYTLSNGIETPALGLGVFDSELEKTNCRGEVGGQRMDTGSSTRLRLSALICDDNHTGGDPRA